MGQSTVKLSKRLCFVLRHHPEAAGIELSGGGWAEVDALLAGLAGRETPLDRETLARIVREDPKERFAFSPDGRRIRANYGHSVPVALESAPVAPPAQLYHGTARRFLDSIRRDGLHPRSRQFVHLSPDRETATSVGRRHGEPVVLTIQAEAMHAAGHAFYRVADGTWLTGSVPAEYLDAPER